MPARVFLPLIRTSLHARYGRTDDSMRCGRGGHILGLVLRHLKKSPFWPREWSDAEYACTLFGSSSGPRPGTLHGYQNGAHLRVPGLILFVLILVSTSRPAVPLYGPGNGSHWLPERGSSSGPSFDLVRTHSRAYFSARGPPVRARKWFA